MEAIRQTWRKHLRMKASVTIHYSAGKEDHQTLSDRRGICRLIP